MKCEMIITSGGPFGEVPVSLRRLNEKVLDPITREFGGVRYYQTQQLWLDDEEDGGREIVHDIGTTVECFVGPDAVAHRGPDGVQWWWRRLARSVCAKWDQDCVFIAFDNEHELIYRTKETVITGGEMMPNNGEWVGIENLRRDVRKWQRRAARYNNERYQRQIEEAERKIASLREQVAKSEANADAR